MAERHVLSLDQKGHPNGDFCIYQTYDEEQEEFIRAKERSWNPSYCIPYKTAPKSGWRFDYVVESNEGVYTVKIRNADPLG